MLLLEVKLTGDKYESRSDGGKQDPARYGRKPSKSPKSYQNGSRVTEVGGNEARGCSRLSKTLRVGKPPRKIGIPKQIQMTCSR